MWKETDGHNCHVKGWRECAMRAGHCKACTTVKEEVHAQIYNGGQPGVYPVALSIDYSNQQEIKDKAKLDGFQNFHVFHFNDDGSITAWKAFGIGCGTTFPKDFLDQMYKGVKSDERLEANRFPQGNTGAHFFLKGKDENDKLVKVYPSRQRQKKKKEQSQVERANKRQRKVSLEVEEKKQQASNLESNHFCWVCENGFPSLDKFEEHNCESLKRELDMKRETTEESKERLRQEILNVSENDFLNPDSIACDTSKIPMGRGIVSYRVQRPTNYVWRKIVASAVEKGRLISGNRQSVLEMYSECKQKLPKHMWPDIQQVAALSANELKRKNNSDTTVMEGTSHVDMTTATRSEQVKRQEEAATLSREQQHQTKNRNMRHLFLGKYIGVNILMEDPQKQPCTKTYRVVTNVIFDKEKEVWMVEASKTSPHPNDNRYKFLCKNQEHIMMKVGSTTLGRYIKYYNKDYECL